MWKTSRWNSCTKVSTIECLFSFFFLHKKKPIHPLVACIFPYSQWNYRWKRNRKYEVSLILYSFWRIYTCGSVNTRVTLLSHAMKKQSDVMANVTFRQSHFFLNLSSTLQLHNLLSQLSKKYCLTFQHWNENTQNIERLLHLWKKNLHSKLSFWLLKSFKFQSL